MGVPITSLEDFQAKFEHLKHQRDLFAFFLFDERPSQRAVERFADEQFEWLDALAAAARIFLFVFLRRNREERQIVENPGLEVGSIFGIRPNQLPGIVLFTLAADREGVSRGVYLPIKAELFEKDLLRVEDVFSDLFSLIQECRQRSDSPEQLLTEVDSEVKSLLRTERLRPIKSYLKQTLLELGKLPTRVVESVSAAVATSMVRQGF
ncbi:MAG: hypothetical protein ACE5IZ_02030 [Dehalococcoidia bacterium]